MACCWVHSSCVCTLDEILSGGLGEGKVNVSPLNSNRPCSFTPPTGGVAAVDVGPTQRKLQNFSPICGMKLWFFLGKQACIGERRERSLVCGFFGAI